MSESKLMFVLWDDRTGDRLGQALRDPGLRGRLAGAGVRRVQLDLEDEDAAALRRQAFARPVRAVVKVWTTGSAAAVALVLRGVADEVAGWRVEEHRLLEPAPGRASPTHAVVAVVRRAEGPDVSADDPWLRRWLEHHAAVATANPTTVGYVQDVVVAAVTRDAPAVHAIVEEMTDGGDADPVRRVTRLVESVATIGADRDLDLVPTSRCVLDLTGSGPG